MNIALPQSPQVLAHRSGISSQYDVVHALCLSSHSEFFAKSVQMQKIISKLGAAILSMNICLGKAICLPLIHTENLSGAMAAFAKAIAEP